MPALGSAALCSVLLATAACGGGRDEVAAGAVSISRDPPAAPSSAPTPPTTERAKPPRATTVPAPITLVAEAQPGTSAPAPAPPRPPAPTATTAPPAPPPPPPPSNPRIQTVTGADLPHSWRSGCPIAPDRLRRIIVTHVGFDGADHTGQLIVHADWADALLGVFDRIHAAGFPIERMEPVDAYGGSDDASMAANNTSAFNCRAVTGGTSWSRHSYGRAIDINPVQNPYVTSGGTVLPPSGAGYAYDRSPRQGVITADSVVVQAFAAIGWEWGGNWSSPTDYQHVERG